MSISSTELRFLHGLLTDVGDRSQSRTAERFSSEYNIGTRIGRKFVYSQDDIVRIHDLLLALNLPLVAHDSATDRAGAVERAGISEKSGTIAPHVNSVAFRVFHNDRPMSMPGYQVGSVEDVSEISSDLVMVVENFETFRQLEQYEWVMARLRTVGTMLVLVRGDNIYRLDESKACLNHLECPVWGFHDFDPAGLHMSAVIDRLEEHLIPDEHALIAQLRATNRTDLYYSQLDQYASTLDKCVHPQVAHLWKLMKKMQRALPQEWTKQL